MIYTYIYITSMCIYIYENAFTLPCQPFIPGCMPASHTTAKGTQQVLCERDICEECRTGGWMRFVDQGLIMINSLGHSCLGYPTKESICCFCLIWYINELSWKLQVLIHVTTTINVEFHWHLWGYCVLC